MQCVRMMTKAESLAGRMEKLLFDSDAISVQIGKSVSKRQELMDYSYGDRILEILDEFAIMERTWKDV